MKLEESRRRIFTSNGEEKLNRINVDQRNLRYVYDYVTTLLDLSWSWILLLLAVTFVISWLVFAGIWFGIMKIHGDFGPIDHVNCVDGVKTFTGCLLLSIETQQTIGYGTRSVTEQCSSGLILLVVQTCFGLILQSLWVGIVYTKLIRPKKRRHTLLWSRQAVISLRDKYLTLQVRLGEIRSQSILLDAQIRMYFISRRITQEGEIIPLDLLDMNVGFDTGRDRLLLVWPLVIEHRIDSKSPLWSLDREKLTSADFELLVVFEGVIESTGLLTQTRHSYIPDDIVWGARFEPMLRNDPDAPLTIDYSKFDALYCDTCTKPCSANEL
ncbi:unnamed protein product [Rotaria socialis]|uniref:Uncharacterized protein n=1 Tax=Rotaria socialis TaxID=392032 RepID=A0A818C087_9BILA|nr:unnamed protein product [Rotaria socialis]